MPPGGLEGESSVVRHEVDLIAQIDLRPVHVGQHKMNFNSIVIHIGSVSVRPTRIALFVQDILI